MSNPSTLSNQEFCKSLSRFSAIFAIVIGGLALAGWAFDITALKSILPKFSSMNPTTALCFILLGGAFLIHRSSHHKLERILAVVCSLLVLFIALSRLGAIIFGFSFSPDRLFFLSKLGNNHIAPNTAFNFVLLSIAQLMLKYPKNLIRHACIIVAIMGSFMALVGYAYDVHALYEMPAFISMALNTATAFFVLSCGMLCFEPDYGLVGILANEGISGTMTRRLLPSSIIALVILGWLRLMGQRLGFYTPEIGVLVFLFFVIIVFVVLIWQNAIVLDKIDVERQKKTKELERSNQELEQFAYVASHDLQEPLRMVASFTQKLEQKYKDKLDAQANEYIDFAVDGAKRMQGLIDDLLSFSKIGQKDVPRAKVDLNEVCHRILEDMKLTITDNQAIVEWDTLPVFYANETQMAQLFLNLISNGMKYRSERSPLIKISSQKIAEHQWQFSVSDNGIGIDEKYFGKLFVIFQRLHTKKEYKGTGIGLALCKKIVENYDGRIWITSKIDEGTTLHFILNEGENT